MIWNKLLWFTNQLCPINLARTVISTWNMFTAFGMVLLVKIMCLICWLFLVSEHDIFVNFSVVLITLNELVGSKHATIKFLAEIFCCDHLIDWVILFFQFIVISVKPNGWLNLRVTSEKQVLMSWINRPVQKLMTNPLFIRLFRQFLCILSQSSSWRKQQKQRKQKDQLW